MFGSGLKFRFVGWAWAAVVALVLGLLTVVAGPAAAAGDGTPDTAFSTNAGALFDDLVASVASQPDGKIVVGGEFTNVIPPTPSNRLARLDADGSPDATFNSNLGTALNDGVYTVAVQATNQDTQTDTLNNGFTYAAAPQPTPSPSPSISPSPTASPSPTPSISPSPTASPSPTTSPSPTPSISPSPTTSPSPTPKPTPKPSPKEQTVLRVQGAANGKSISANERTRLVKSLRTNGKVTKVTESCLLKGNKLNKRDSARLCDISVANRHSKKLRITAAPTCTQGLKVRVAITVKKAGATKNTWRKTYRVKANPAIGCSLAGTG